MTRGALAVGAAIAVAASCRSPTEITLVLRTDAPCADVKRVAVYVGDESAPEATDTATCAGGTIGTLALVPSGAKDDALRVRVVADLGDPSGCAPPAYGPACIVARRQLRYVPHTPLTLPIDLRASCEGVLCDPTTTCVAGVCRGATIASPDACASGGGCNESVLPPAPNSPTPAPTPPLPAGAGFVGQSTANAPAGGAQVTTTLAIPAHVAAGDLMWLAIYTDLRASAVAAPSDWTRHNDFADVPHDFRGTWFFKTAAASEPDLALTLTNVGPAGWSAALVAYRGVGPPPQSAVAVFNDAPPETGDFSVAPLTTNAATSVIVLMFVDDGANQNPSTAWVAPPGFAPRAVTQVPHVFVTDELYAGPGATGTLVTSGPVGGAAVDAVALPVQ